MDTTYPIDPQMFGAGLLVARVVFGLLMAGHGAQKWFGWFGGYGLNATGQFMVQLGYGNGRLFAAAAAISEVVSGLLVAFGLLGAVGPAMIVAVMIVAAVTVHWGKGVFATAQGFEMPLLYATAAVTFGLAGFGPFSLDHALGIESYFTKGVTLALLGLGVIGGVLNLAIRRPSTASA